MDGFVTLAHQGGWDEILMVAGPILVFALLLWTANKRAARLQEDDAGDAPLAPEHAPHNERGGPR